MEFTKFHQQRFGGHSFLLRLHRQKGDLASFMRIDKRFSVVDLAVLLDADVQKYIDVFPHHPGLGVGVSLLPNDGVGALNIVFECGLHSR